jgi:hypothetical protein
MCEETGPDYLTRTDDLTSVHTGNRGKWCRLALARKAEAVASRLAWLSDYERNPMCVHCRSTSSNS